VAHAGRTRERAHEIFRENAENAHDFFQHDPSNTGAGRWTRETRAAIWTMLTATQLGTITAADGVRSRERVKSDTWFTGLTTPCNCDVQASSCFELREFYWRKT